MGQELPTIEEAADKLKTTLRRVVKTKLDKLKATTDDVDGYSLDVGGARGLNNFVDYKLVRVMVVKVSDYDKVERQVNALFKKGYELWGDLIVEHYPRGGHTDVVQPMIKYRGNR